MFAKRGYDPQIYANCAALCERVSTLRVDDDSLDLEEKRRFLLDIGIRNFKIGSLEYHVRECLPPQLRTVITRISKGATSYMKRYKKRYKIDNTPVFGRQEEIEFSGTLFDSTLLLSDWKIDRAAIRGIFARDRKKYS